MNPTINSIVSKAIELSAHCTKVESLIITSATALTSGAPDASINECLSIATENSNAVLNGLDDIQIAVQQLSSNKTNGIPREKIKNLSRDTGEIYHLLTMIIDSMRADSDLNANYENSLSGVKKLMAKAHGELFELGGGQ